MKKFCLFLIVICLLSIGFLGGCTSTEELHCYVPDGAPALAVANVIDSKKIGTHNVTTTVTTGEEVIAKCQSGEADFAILPTNAAVTICTKRTEYCFFSVNIHGLLYLVGTRQINSLNELLGEKVYSIGLGNTPEYVFKKVLDSKSVGYGAAGQVDLQYVSDGATVIPMILQGKADFAVLGEPAVTNLIAKAASQNKTVYRLGDLQQLWQQATQSSQVGYPQAGLIVKRSLLKNSAFAKALDKAVADNAKYLQESCSSLNDLMKQAGSNLDVAYTPDILNKCNLSSVLAYNIKGDIQTYLAEFPAMSNFLPLSDDIFYKA